MKNIRHTHNLFGERRLIYMGMSDAVEGVFHEVSRWGGMAMGSGAEILSAIPKGLAKGLEDVLIEDELEGKRLIYSAYNFLQGAPALRSVFDRYDFSQLDSIEEMKNFFAVENWVRLYQNFPEIVTTQKPNTTAVSNDQNKDILNFLLTEKVSMQERKIIFAEFVSRYIPESIREEHEDAFSSLKELNNLDATAVSRMAKLSGGVLGVNSRDDFDGPNKVEDTKIVEDSLQQQLVYNEDLPTNSAYAEYLSTLRLMKLQSLSKGAEDPQVLLRHMQPSTLRGGINFGVVSEEMLTSMHNHALSTMHEEQKGMAKISENLESLTGVTERQVRREARTMADTWYQMPQLQKIAAVAVLVGILMHKGTRKLAVGLGAAYFAQKFFLKDEGARLLSQLSDKAAGGISSLNDKIIGDLDSSLEGEGIAKRTEVVSKFLTEFDSVNLENEGTGLSLLSNVPLKDLALSFKTEGSNWVLNTDSNAPAMQILRQNLRNQGLKMSALGFFKEPDVNREISDAMSWVFYKKALEDPSNSDLAQKVEESWGSNPMRGRNMGELFRSDESTPGGIAYRTLVERGRNLAGKNGTEKLSDFMIRHINEVQEDTQQNLAEVSNLTAEEQQFIEGFAGRDVVANPLTLSEERQLIQLLPEMSRLQKKRMQEVLEKQVSHNFSPATVDPDGIERASWLFAGLPERDELNRLRHTIINHCENNANIDAALQIALVRDVVVDSSQKDKITFVLNRIVVLQAESLMKELQQVSVANIEDNPKYTYWLSVAEKLYICSPESADHVTDIASFLLEYLLYRGRYADKDEVGLTGKEKFESYLSEMRTRYGLGRELRISNDIAANWYALGKHFTRGAEDRLGTPSEDWNGDIFTISDFSTDNLEERIAHLKKEYSL